MADELSNYLMDGSSHAALSAESMELIGKQAANRLLNDGIPLNESIVKLAGEHQDINSEQIRRIIEFANNAVYLAKHDQNKTAGAESSYPQFELADPARVIQDLSNGSRPSLTTPVSIEYSKPPKKAHISDRDTVIEQIFGIDPEKKVEANFHSDTAANQIIDTKNDLLGIKSNLENHAERFSMALKEAQVEYYDLVRHHLLDGNNFSDILAAAQSSGADKHKIAETLRPVIEQLLKDKIASPSKLRVATEQLEKIAHRVVNEKHLLVSTFRSLLALESEIDKLATSLDDVDTQLGRVNGFIKEQFFAESTH